MNRLKNRIVTALCIFLTGLLLIFSAILPPKILQFRDKMLYSTMHQRQRNSNTLNINMEEIALVKSMRKMYSKEFAYQSHPIYGQMGIVKREVAKMSQQGLLTQSYVDYLSRFDHYELGTHGYSVGGYESQLESVLLISAHEKDNAVNDFVIDPFTEKIISFRIDAEVDALPGAEPNELLEQYIRYLGLDILDDWRYENQGCVSPSAQLQIFLKVSNSHLLATGIAYSDISMEIMPIPSVTGVAESQ